MNTDTNSSTTIQELTEMLVKKGFERVLFEKYVRDAYGNKEESYLFVFWQKDMNVMVSGTTYPKFDYTQTPSKQIGHSINSGTMYYKIKSKGNKANYNLLSSYGTKEDGTIEGSHDIRNGIMASLEALEREFDFLPWNEYRHLWLVHYTEEKRTQERDYYDIVIYQNMKKLPKYVKEAIHDELYIMGDKTQVSLLEDYAKENKAAIISAMNSYKIEKIEEVVSISKIRKVYFIKDSEKEGCFLNEDGELIATVLIEGEDISLDIKRKGHPLFYDYTETFKKFLVTKKEIVRSVKEIVHTAISIAIEEMEIDTFLEGDFAPTIKKVSEDTLSVDMRGTNICQIKTENKKIEVIPGVFYKFWDAPLIGWADIILKELAKKGGFEMKN